MARRRMARGWFGGDLSKERGGISVVLEVPEIVDIEVDWNDALKKSAQAEAKRIRDRLKRGIDGDGQPLPAPMPLRAHAPAGQPLNRSGRMIDSIKWSKGEIAPSTNRRYGISDRARSNYGLLKIHIAGVYVRRGKDSHKASARRGGIDPLGSQDPELQKRLNEGIQKAIDKQRKKFKTRAAPPKLIAA